MADRYNVKVEVSLRGYILDHVISALFTRAHQIKQHTQSMDELRVEELSFPLVETRELGAKVVEGRIAAGALVKMAMLLQRQKDAHDAQEADDGE